MKFPYEPMEVVERHGYEETPYFLIQTKAERDGWEVAEIRPDIPNQRKVANLLSAAPDLLEALEDALSDYDAWMKDADVTPNESLLAWTNKARAAIARARGEA